MPLVVQDGCDPPASGGAALLTEDPFDLDLVRLAAGPCRYELARAGHARRRTMNGATPSRAHIQLIGKFIFSASVRADFSLSPALG